MVERMLGVVLRNEEAMRHAEEMLEVDDFAEHQRGYAAVYAVALDFYEEHAALPQYDDLVDEVERRLDENPEGLSDDELALLDKWLKDTYEIPDEHFAKREMLRVFRKYLKMFLEDRTTDKIREDFSSQATVDVFNYLKNLEEKTRRISLASEGGIQPLFAPGWSKNNTIVELRDTTLPFLNAMLDGGDGCGEVNGLLAPFGTCKTTMAMQMATGRARRCRQDWISSGKTRPLGIVYVFIYEGTIEQMRLRALNCAAQVRREKLKDLSELNRRGVYDEYERQIFRDMFENDTPVPCEKQRVRTLSKVLNTNLQVICMTGSDKENPGRGSGYVEEIARIIEQDQTQQKSRYNCETFVECVIVDYVGAAVERASTAHNWTDSQRRNKTERFPLYMQQLVAGRFSCPCWCLHQLSGQANSFAPGKVPKGTDAKDTKSFKENLDFLFVVGSKNHQDLCCWVVDKARRFDTKLPPEVVFVDGEMGRVHSVSREYVLDRQTEEIVQASELRGMYADHSGSQQDEEEYADMAPATMAIQTQMREIASGRRRRRT